MLDVLNVLVEIDVAVGGSRKGEGPMADTSLVPDTTPVNALGSSMSSSLIPLLPIVLQPQEHQRVAELPTRPE